MLQWLLCIFYSIILYISSYKMFVFFHVRELIRGIKCLVEAHSVIAFEALAGHVSRQEKNAWKACESVYIHYKSTPERNKSELFAKNSFKKQVELNTSTFAVNMHKHTKSHVGEHEYCC